MPRYAIAYDISDNSRRRKVSNCLDSYGDRVQNSVFEMVVSQSMLKNCLNQVSKIINSTEDKVAVYFICNSCEPKRVYLGKSEGISDIGDESVFVV